MNFPKVKDLQREVSYTKQRRQSKFYYENTEFVEATISKIGDNLLAQARESQTFYTHSFLLPDKSSPFLNEEEFNSCVELISERIADWDSGFCVSGNFQNKSMCVSWEINKFGDWL